MLCEIGRLTLYNTITTFNDLEKKTLENTWEKE